MAALWSDHTQAMLTLRSIFLYLDRTYVVPCAGPRSLFDLGLQLLRTHLDQHPAVCMASHSGRMSCHLTAGCLHLLLLHRQLLLVVLPTREDHRIW